MFITLTSLDNQPNLILAPSIVSAIQHVVTQEVEPGRHEAITFTQVNYGRDLFAQVTEPPATVVELIRRAMEHGAPHQPEIVK